MMSDFCDVYDLCFQGRVALEDHFKNSRFACDTDEYLPLVFVPPRNGVETPAPKVAKLGRTYCVDGRSNLPQHEVESKVRVNMDSCGRLPKEGLNVEPHLEVGHGGCNGDESSFGGDDCGSSNNGGGESEGNGETLNPKQ